MNVLPNKKMKLTKGGWRPVHGERRIRTVGARVGMAHVFRRMLRGAYWVGLLLGPFFGTSIIVGGVFAAMHRLGLTRGILPFVFIAPGLLIWMGLTYAYRALVPLPCAQCGRSARTTSLNPITVRCTWCGHVQEFEMRVLGAP